MLPRNSADCWGDAEADAIADEKSSLTQFNNPNRRA